MRRLPVYLVLDVSGSMHGEPIEAVRNGMQMLVSTLRTDPYALETAFLSVIVFDEKARQVVPLTELMAFQPPTVEAGSTTSLGDALKVVKECIEREVKKTTAEEKGDWKPLVFIMTDGQPTDDWEKGLNEFRKVKTGMVIACAAGPQADTKILKQITEVVVSLDTADSSTIGAFFKWVSASISTSSKKVDLTKAESSEISELPPPPPQITLV
ncbi:vWA domain-containing protein [Magnetospirillum molischianum]|uniref:von Willebrand factor, type A n=1 Tax=Magnetospirillum molischianum DSM 120 TaxID=1150626 RepID=H8FWF7_MAGML|nr:VWA domain-containing protein [Magnetospirillum molischianum]CCG42695.1 von Willebrand factor, type A [Magnetospirillum molischianum DSM 120]